MNRFDELDQSMRVYETTHDHCVMPNLWMVARIDGRSFTRLTKEICQFEPPFDPRFHALMQGTVRHLMNCGFNVIYGYTQSDEISLLFHPDIEVFKRKARKYNSILAGEASAWFSLHAGHVAAFDCRISELPTLALVEDYFIWRQEDAHRNALNAHCYWMLRQQGHGVNVATERLSRMLNRDKQALLLHESGVNFNDIPLWQKRGTGFYFSQQPKQGFNPKNGEPTLTTRRSLLTDEHLSYRQEYRAWLRSLIDQAAPATSP
jgi:tRNA(His) guanylyltransferase